MPSRRQPGVRHGAGSLRQGDRLVRQGNRCPSRCRRDNDFFSPFFAAGFYYKTFMWPKARIASLYEPIIRRAAGLGSAPKQGDTDQYASRFAHCDVLVVAVAALPV